MSIHYNANLLPGEAMLNSLTFDGVNDTVQMGTGTTSHLGDSGMTGIRARFYVEFTGAGPSIIAKCGNATRGWAIGYSETSVGGDTARLGIRLEETGTITKRAFYVSLGSSLVDGKEHLIEVLAVSNTTTEIWIDGVSQTCTTDTDNGMWLLVTGLTAQAHVGSDTGNCVMDNGGWGGFTSGSDFAAMNLRWCEFSTWNGSAWVPQVEFHVDEGTGTSLDNEQAGLGSGTITSATWNSDIVAPLGLSTSSSLGHTITTFSRWAGWATMKGDPSYSADDAQFRLHIQRDTQSDFSTAVDILPHCPSISDGPEHEHFPEDAGYDAYDPELDPDEQFEDFDVVHNTTYYYRARIRQYASGSVTKTGVWSDSSNVTYNGGFEPGDLGGSQASTSPQPLTDCMVLLHVGIGGANTNAADSVDQLGVDLDANVTTGSSPKFFDNQIDGILGSGGLFEGWVASKRVGLFLRAPFGNEIVFDDVGTPTTAFYERMAGRFNEGPSLSFAAEGYFANTGILDPWTSYRIGQGHSAESEIESLVDDFITYYKPWADLVPTVAYISPYSSENRYWNASNPLRSIGGNLILSANIYFGLDTLSPSSIYDYEIGTGTDTKTRAALLADALEALGQPFFAEPGHGHVDRVTQWLDNASYTNYHSITAFSNLYDDSDYAANKVLGTPYTPVLNANRPDPADYDNIVWVWITTTFSSWVAAGADAAAKAARMIDTAQDILALNTPGERKYRVLMGPLNVVDDMTQSDVNDLYTAVEELVGGLSAKYAVSRNASLGQTTHRALPL